MTNKVSSFETRRTIHLKNGLTVVLENMPYRKAVAVGLWVPVGSAVETAGEAGYSHFVEHMLFKGTTRRSYSDISREIDRVGGYINASTSRELTNYYVVLSGRHVNIALDVLSDMYFNSSFVPKEYNTEKGVILEEIRMSQDEPGDYVFDLFYENAFPKATLGRPIAGSLDSIKDSTRKKLFDYYAKHYGTQGAVLSLAGGLYSNEKEYHILERSIQRLFGRKNHQLVGTPSLNKLSNPGPLSGKITHKQKKLEQVHFILGLSCEPFLPRGFADMVVFDNLMGGSMSSRLFRKLREENGLCYSVGSHASPYYHNGVWLLYCASSQKNFVKAVTLAVKEIRQVLKKGPTDEEVKENISNLVGGFELSMESPQHHARYNAHGLLYSGELLNKEEGLAEYQRVNPESVIRKMRNLWKGASITMTSLGDLSKQQLKEVRALLESPLF